MPVTATVDKNSPTAKLGLSIKRSSVTGTTRIGRVSDEGLFASTSLKEGMKVISINDTRVAGMELGDILDVLKNAEGTVTIVADEDSVAEPAKPKAAVAPPSPVAARPSVSKSLSNKASGLKEYTATVTRKSPEDKLGITLKRNPGDGTTVIGKINPEGLFASSKLKEGMQVVSVNNVQASESTLYDLLDVLKGADGPITILAKEGGGPTPPTAPQRGSLRDLLFGAEDVKSAAPLKHITAVVTKETADSRLGVSIKRLPSDGSTLVGKIAPESPFAKTDLKEGMKILKVNNRDCSAMDLEDLLALLKESTGPITVLAEDVAGGAAKPRGSISSVASVPASVPAQRVVATVSKEAVDSKLGISIRRTSVSGTTLVGRVAGDGPFAETGLKEGMKVVSIKAADTDCSSMELEEILNVLKTATGDVTIVAEPYAAAPRALPSAGSTRTSFKALPPPEGSGHSIIFKKTFKAKGMGVKTQSLSFHGQGVSQTMIDTVNRHLSSIRYGASANPLKFTKDSLNHYAVEMNHDCQKYHEEDALAAVFDALEVLGWGFRFQYASNYQSSNTSSTSRDIFIFAKLIEI